MAGSDGDLTGPQVGQSDGGPMLPNHLGAKSSASLHLAPWARRLTTAHAHPWILRQSWIDYER